MIAVDRFDFSNEASLREPPTLDVSRKLLNNFAVDGFESACEPVLIRLNQACQMNILNTQEKDYQKTVTQLTVIKL